MGIVGISEEDWENPKQRSSTCFMLLICFIKWFRCICIFSFVSAACMFIFSEYANSLVRINHLSSIKAKKRRSAEVTNTRKWRRWGRRWKRKMKIRKRNRIKMGTRRKIYWQIIKALCCVLCVNKNNLILWRPWALQYIACNNTVSKYAFTK